MKSEKSPFSCVPDKSIRGKLFLARAESCRKTARANPATHVSRQASVADELPKAALPLVAPESLRCQDSCGLVHRSLVPVNPQIYGLDYIMYSMPYLYT